LVEVHGHLFGREPEAFARVLGQLARPETFVFVDEVADLGRAGTPDIWPLPSNPRVERLAGPFLARGCPVLGDPDRDVNEAGMAS
jgi:hypothetical protein